MSLYGASTEYVLHSLLWLVNNPQPVSSLDLSELQNIPAAFVAKLLPKLEKAGILEASEGLRGGYRLARAPDQISVLEAIDAVEGRKSLFNCQEIRERCVLFNDSPPAWTKRGVCSIHAVMLRAEQVMRQELAQTSLSDLAQAMQAKVPPPFPKEVLSWLDERAQTRRVRKVRQRRRSDVL
ncbi:Rrf2 family transcriptional regulator [Acetobacter estunensis]|uniref:RrF2 family transcriptional regulator n=1 Tax=Acetobacter estunensis TaxID=104097 RepID=UPI001C2D2F97|nr:Rrf2 family transcriptional regulator [Acetobacter estunensis]MBV1837548.1 Rrf2 family transcriptional regulator [Acetobacter estunensis]